MRYLTHESEDNYWISHGAKPHPLAQAEAEKRTQLEQQAIEATMASSVADSNQKTVHFQEVTTYSNGNLRVSNNVRNSVTSEDNANSTVELLNSRDDSSSISSNGSKKDYLKMTDDEVVKSQEHAQRIGYKITTV